ncbi:hypothetical protein [Nostoc sp. MS1]|uniref:hypothetical protein n=1 Tax=Nostoc sp. MS1 TaxID=2764711 RepID=UPI001CC3B365|nr:hypothetical protein [Nostoc sp. MS1]BCL37673.1 hypothetical protein NSMS1_41200 [Nostoc sp. MS1]
MMKKHLTIVTILLSTILLGGITSCSSPKSSDASTTETSGTDASQTSVPEANSSQTDRVASTQRREEVRKQIEAVLTPDQVKQLQEKLQQGERMRKALYSLNLSDEQKTKIQSILKSNYTQRQR